MRCRKARSLLSTYSNNELEGRQQVLLREHLAACANCRREYNLFASINEAKEALPEKTVSADFNAKLLNRIAQERFVETRTKAYHPKRAPIFTWWRVAPVVATTMLLAFVTINTFIISDNSSNLLVQTVGNGNDYLSAQPTNNPNMTTTMSKNWSLNRQMAKAKQNNSISNSMIDRSGFGNNQLASATMKVPNRSVYYRVRPVIKIYETSGTKPTEEGSGTF